MNTIIIIIITKINSPNKKTRPKMHGVCHLRRLHVKDSQVTMNLQAP